MQWQELNDINQLNELVSNSFDQPVLIFKHSTRCSISSMALDRLERAWQPSEMEALSPWFLDLIAHRDISNKVAELFKVEHQSPQVLLIKNGDVTYHTSHMGIGYGQVKDALSQVLS